MITNLLRLLSLEIDVPEMLNNEQLELGHAKVLLALTGHHQKHAAHTVRQQQ